MSNKDLIAEAREWSNSYVSWGDNGLVDRLLDALEAATRERDAALAVVERVRAIHYPFTPQLCYLNAQGGQSPMTSVHCHHCNPKGSKRVGDPDTWPCATIQALDGVFPETDNAAPCDAEVRSWDYYQPEQIDLCWIRCTRLGTHDEHEDSHTGLKWRSGLPVEGEEK
jgi:hypothetical protein